MSARRTHAHADRRATLDRRSRCGGRPPRPWSSATPRATAAPRPPAPTGRRCTTYARDTWRSIDAMTDPATGLPADNIERRAGRRHAAASTPRRPTSARYLWSTVVARDTRPDQPARGQAADARRRCARSPAWSATSRAGCSTTGTTRTPARSCASGPRTATPSSRSCPASTTAGWPPALLLVSRAEPPLADAGRRGPRSRWTSASTTTPSRERARRPDPRRLLGRGPARARRGQGQLPRPRPGRLVHRPPLRRLQHRAPHRVLPRHRRGPDPARALLRHLPHLPQRQLRLVLDRDQAGRRVGRVPRCAGSSRARCPTAAWTSSRPGAAACSRR